ncbi:MAG TPA: GlsB/YeaQ/YmgE family stress response membrane protein [Dehalococcoidia bacterium]|nr:GlsB/YeaQ/YmgE family stress response membrane protein [Dehalococcoidia bacterium]
MNILSWLLVGLIGGLIARWLMPGSEPGGIILTILLGIAGAIVGGFLAVALGLGNGIDDFDIGTIVLSVIGAMLLLAIYRMIFGTRRGFF